MFEAIFEFLFKFRPILFQEGSIRLVSPGALPVVGLGLLIGVVALGSYRIARAKSDHMDRAVLASLRAALFLIILFCLLRPALILSTVVPQRNFVGVLIDDSRSMALADGDGGVRADFVRQALAPDESALISRLSERFAIRLFRFSKTAERIDSLSDLGFGGTGTDLAGALRMATQELAGVPLSGLVVLTDGADNAGEAVGDVLLPLQAEGTPVFTIGLGDEFVDRDLQVTRVETPRRVLAGASLVVDVVVSHVGYGGRTVSLVVEDEGRLVATQDVELGRTGEPTTVRVHFTARDPGPRLFSFRVPALDGETITQNNERDALIVVDDRREKILYFEGEPRPEAKFVRRAVSGDDNLQLVVLQRTAEKKFLRLDVDDPDELLGGFPQSRDELFRYRALVLGSVEASHFSIDQLQMISDFVSERGGGLLVLGGRHALAEGGYAGTPLATALPVEIEDPVGGPELTSDLVVRPTRAGRSHPVTQIADSEDASADLWSELPAVTSFNPILSDQLKPGATALLEAEADDGSRIVLAHQRYGRGKSLVLPINDSWFWQMDASIPVDDMTHETFWRQLLRWLVDGVPDPVVATPGLDRVEPGDPVQLRATVDDSTFIEVNGARVSARVVAPSGDERTETLEWTVDRDGEYAGSATLDEPGLYRVDVAAEREGQPIGGDVMWVRAAPSDAEYFDAGMKAGVLQRLASETGGRFYTAGTSDQLPEDIQYAGAGVTLIEEEELWDMPIVFLLALLLLAAEWGYRRWRELA